MLRNSTAFTGLAIAILCGASVRASAEHDDLSWPRGSQSLRAGQNVSPMSQAVAPEHLLGRNQASSASAELKLNPSVFFQRLVDRYRGLHLYRDVVDVVQVTRRDGRESNRVETQISCEVAGGKLTVQTPQSQARQGLGVDLPIKQSQKVQEAQQKFDLWLAPHMALKFTQEPLKELRSGVDEAFTATEAEPVTIDNKKMVHVELRSGCTDNAADPCAAKVDLYVNSDSLLIERIDTEQKLPDGADYSTTLRITPGEVQGEMPSEEPAMPARPVAVPAT